ncbi:hypothetical protein LMIY3S_05109 [Labrys miyagiensis]
MSRRTLIGVIAGLGLLTGLGTALAQEYTDDYAPLPPRMGWNRPAQPPGVDIGGDQLLPPRVIINSLSRRGYRNVDIKRVRGDSYIAEASGPQGGRVLIVVDGHTTEITGLRQIGWDRPPRRWDDDGWLPPRPWSGPRW